MVPVLFGSLLIGSVFYLQRRQPSPLSGELKAVVVDAEFVAKGLVHRDVTGLPSERVAALLDALEIAPERITTNLMAVEFQNGRRGILVQLQSGPQARFFKVRINKNRALRKFYDEHAVELDQPRDKELAAAAKQFVLEWEGNQKTGEDFEDLAGYRDSLAIGTLVGGLGYHTRARLSAAAYRCVYEDSEGLYFLLPANTTRFEIEGRELLDGSRLFPGHYTVRVSPSNP